MGRVARAARVLCAVAAVRLYLFLPLISILFSLSYWDSSDLNEAMDQALIRSRGDDVRRPLLIDPLGFGSTIKVN